MPRFSVDALGYRVREGVLHRGQSLAPEDRRAHRESAVDPRRESFVPRGYEERIDVEILALRDGAGVPGVQPRLPKTVLKARMETEVEEMVFPAQRSKMQSTVEGPRSLDERSGVEPEMVRCGDERPVELDEDAGHAAAKAGRVIRDVHDFVAELLEPRRPSRERRPLDQ